MAVPDPMNDPVTALMRADPEVAEALDRYAADATGSPSPSELVLRVLRDWLATNGYLRSDPLDGMTAGEDGPEA